MHCTGCGQTVPPGARFCADCGQAAAPVAAIGPLPRLGNPLARMSLGGFLVLIFAVLWILSQLSGPSGSPAPARAVAADSPAAIAARVKACDDAVAALARAGVLRGKLRRTWAEVDETGWAALPADTKRVLAAGMRCSALRGVGLDSDAVLLIEGYHSGKQLAAVGPGGATFD